MSIRTQPGAVPLSPLVAREAELRNLLRLWRSSRLATLYGQSGVGKSTLALAAAAEVADGSAARVLCLDARGAGGRLPVLRLLAGVRRQTPRPSPTAQPPFFVLLDHLPTAAHEAAHGILQWLVAHPEAHLLIVSPCPLDLLGEQAMPLAPLAMTIAGAGAPPAVELLQSFVHGAQPDGPGVEPETADAICNALDGLPAALESAAALVGTVPEAEIARLARTDPLSLTLRGRPLRAIATATWDNLPSQARCYLTANAEWPVTFSDHAAAHLNGHGATASITARLLQLGLLRIAAERPHLRYVMSPLIRPIAIERGAATGMAGQERMARYLLGVLERPSPGSEAPWPARDDLPALRWAWRWLAGQRDGEAVARFARALAAPLRHSLGEPVEASELLQSALAWARAAGSRDVSVLESQMAAAECLLGRLETAEARLRALLETELSPDEIGLVHLRLGMVHAYRGRHAAAVEERRKARGRFRSAASEGSGFWSEVALAWTLHGLAEDQRRLRDMEAARAALEESGWLFARAGCPVGRAAYLAALAVHHAERGETEEAIWHARESLRLAEAGGDRPGQARALQVHAGLMGQSDPARGLALGEESVLLWQRCSRPAELADAWLDVAEISRKAELPPERSLGPARTALQLAGRYGYHAVEAAALLSLAESYQRLGRWERAESYAEEARHACERTDDALVRGRCEQWHATARRGERVSGRERVREERPEADPQLTIDNFQLSIVNCPARQASAPLPPAEPAPLLLIRLLGPLRVEGPDGAALPLRLRPKEQRVLARLALGTGNVVPRDELLELFWPKSNLAAAERSLRTVVSSLRGGLRSVLDGAALALLRGRMDGYCLESAACAVDVTLFTESVQEARGSSGSEEMRVRALAAWRRAVELYRGDLMSAFPYDDWCLAMRERLRDDFLDALFQLARASMAADALEEARALAARMVALDPAEERAHRLLMRCYALLGRPAEAQRQFERCRAALFEELAGRPAPATVALLETIRAGATFVEEEWEETGDATAAVVAPIDATVPERGRSR